MRVGIETWGSDGDIRPLIALAGGLAARGHEVTLAATSVDDKEYSALCAALGVKYVRVIERINLDLARFEKLFRRHNTIKLFRMLLDESFFPHVDAMYRAAQSLCRDSDVAVGHFFMYPLKAAARKAGVPYASVTLCHAFVPTGCRPPMRMPNLGRTLNLAEWRLLDAILNFAIGKKIKAFWEGEGLGPVRNTIRQTLYSDALNLVAASSVFCREEPDWGALHRVCGFLEIPAAAESWSMPGELAAFLNEGAAPVYMTFGSSGQVMADKSAELLIGAARLAGCRAIIQSTSPKCPAGTRDGDVYFAGRAPHHLVFPKCAAVVHHGGAGTTHSATLCGCPSVAVPFSDEQLFWGREMQRAGVAGRPIPVKKVTVEKLARAIRVVLDRTDMRRRAAELGRTMRQENGVARAAGLIEGLGSGR